MTDHERILHKFKDNPKGFTSGEWAQETGSVKLSTRIGEMQRDGVVFIETWETTSTGKKVLRYRLAPESHFELKQNQYCYA